MDVDITLRVDGSEHRLVHAFGAQFAEVRVHEDTGEVRVPRLLGVFDVGRSSTPRRPAPRCSSCCPLAAKPGR